MVEISVVVLTLLIEALVISLAVLGVWTAITLKRRARDRQAAAKLVEQIKHQSQTRLESTGSFLSEKYCFEGNELKKAVATIDKAEKKFMQTVLQVYLQRDADRFEAMDASLAELIDSYKSLSPVVPEATSAEAQAELEQLRESNAHLKEELTITKETMSNMISEFGNMFGGGHEHELAKNEVMQRVQKKETEEVDDAALASKPPEESAAEPSAEPVQQQLDSESDADDVDDIILSDSGVDAPADEQLPEDSDEVVSDEGVDELLNGIDLSEDDK